MKIDPYNFELYRFKVGSFLRHSVYSYCNNVLSFPLTIRFCYWHLCFRFLLYDYVLVTYRIVSYRLRENVTKSHHQS